MSPKTPIPHFPTPFFGRAEQLDRLETWFDSTDSRLLALLGPPGVGKSRLLAEFLHGPGTEHLRTCSWLSAEDVSDENPQALDRELITAMNLMPGAQDTVDELLIRWVERQSRTLVLDGLDRGHRSVMPRLVKWMSVCPELRIVVTSRKRPSVVGATVLEVPRLEVPSEDAPPAVIATTPAVKLLAHHVQTYTGDNDLLSSPETLEELVTLARHLDGLPLAFELIAPRAALLSLPQLTEHMVSTEALLSVSGWGGSRGEVSLQQLVAASWELLSPEAKECALNLSWFSGIFSLAEANRCCEGQSVIPSLAELKDASMLRRVEDTAEPHFVLMRTIRFFAAKVLQSESADRAETSRRRFVEVTLERANECIRQVYTPSELAALETLREYEDDFWQLLEDEELAHPIRTTAGLALGHALMGTTTYDVLENHWKSALELSRDGGTKQQTHHAAWGLTRVLYSSGQRERALEVANGVIGDHELDWASDSDEMLRLHLERDRCLAWSDTATVFSRLNHAWKSRRAADCSPSDVDGEILAMQSVAHSALGDEERSLEIHRRAAPLIEAHCPVSTLAFARRNFATCLIQHGQIPEAVAILEKALDLLETAGPRSTRVVLLGMTAAWAYGSVQRHGEAQEIATSYRQLAEVLNSQRALLLIRIFAATIQDDAGQRSDVIEELESVLASARAADYTDAQVRSLNKLGSIAFQRGDHSAAREWLESALEIDGDWPVLQAYAEAMLATILAVQQSYEPARQWIADLRSRLKTLKVPLLATHVRIHEACVEAIGATSNDSAAGDLSTVDEEGSSILVSVLQPLFQSGDAKEACQWNTNIIARDAGHWALALLPSENRRELESTIVDPNRARLLVDRNDQSFRAPSEDWYDFGRKALLRRLWSALLEERLQRPGSPVEEEQLQAAGWPDENPSLEALRNRMHKTLSQLRALPGVRDLLHFSDDGWFLDPGVPVFTLPLTH